MMNAVADRKATLSFMLIHEFYKKSTSWWWFINILGLSSVFIGIFLDKLLGFILGLIVYIILYFATPKAVMKIREIHKG